MLKLQLLMQIFVEELVKSQQLLQILIELFNPEITFYKSESSLQIQELSSIQKYTSKIGKYILSHASADNPYLNLD